MFFITSISYYPELNYSESVNPNKRCFGFFKELSKARVAVSCNVGDLEEQYYNYIVIEEILEGIHSIPISENWYYYNTENGWVPCSKPEWSIGIVNWSIA
jgi:hypothetical protein